MLIQTKIIFQDEKQSELLGKDVVSSEDFIFELKDVSGIIRGANEEQSVIFLGGDPLTIHVCYSELRRLFMEAKGYSEKIVCEK